MKNGVIRERLRQQWAIEAEHMWVPLTGHLQENTAYFEYSQFEQLFGMERLREILSQLSQEPVFAISEVGEDYQGPITIVEEYGSQQLIEMYYCDEHASWVVYVSHENTVTLAGQELLAHVKSAWPDMDLLANPWEVT